MPVVAQVDAWDIDASATIALRIASEDDPDVCHLDGHTWWPTIAELPALRYDLFSGQFDGKVETPGTVLGLATEPWEGFAALGLADARVRLWTGQAGAAWSDWTACFDGRVTAQPAIKDGIATLAVSVDDRWLDTPVLTTYAGTGGAEGHAGLKGSPKALALGAPRYAPGVLIDPINTVVQLSSYGEIEDVEVALERLARFGASSSDCASYAALVAATIPPGGWATAKAVGMVRHGAPPVGKLSYLLKGDKAGTDGWARKPGQIIRRIALLAGGAGKIDEASLDALDAARPWNLSLYVGDQVTARDLIQRVAASVNAVAGVSWLGKLFVAPIGIGASAAMELHADGSALPAIAVSEQVETGPPFWRIDVEAERAWNVHSLEEVAFTAQLIDLGPYVDTTVYREGNIVQHQDTSWVYYTATPSAGHVPPTLPTTINGWWRAWDPKLAGVEPGADVTAQNAPSVDPLPLRAFVANSAGQLYAGQLPTTIPVVRRVGPDDVSSSTVYAITSQQGTGSTPATISSSGALTLPNTINISGNVKGTASRDGIAVPWVQEWTFASDSGILVNGSNSGPDVSATTYPPDTAPTRGPFTFVIPSDGKFALKAALQYYVDSSAPNGTYKLAAKWRYRLAGGTWADFSPGEIVIPDANSCVVTGPPAAVAKGSITWETNIVSGFTPGNTYEFIWVARAIGDTRTRYVTGPVSAGAMQPGTTGTDTQTVTNGYTASSDKYGTTYQWGFSKFLIGSVNDGTSNLYNGAAVIALKAMGYTGYSGVEIYFGVQGNRLNSGWTKMSAGGVDYFRTDADYWYDSSIDTTLWRWNHKSTNPWGTNGANVAVNFV